MARSPSYSHPTFSKLCFSLLSWSLLLGTLWTVRAPLVQIEISLETPWFQVHQPAAFPPEFAIVLQQTQSMQLFLFNLHL